MPAIHTEGIERDETTLYRINIYHDEDNESPLEWSGQGEILSLGRRHKNFDPDGVESALENNRDAIPLSYFEHGQCLWSVRGELPLMAQCPFDSVGLAGVWIPTPDVLDEAKNLGGFTRRAFMRKRARQVVETYTQWCNGEVYSFTVEKVTECDKCGQETTEDIDSCGGFYGFDYCLQEARDAVPSAEPAVN